MKEINGKMFKQMVLSGAIVLHNNHPEVDALNVFPVPDGDTGTNMSLTFNSGAEQVEKLADDTSIGDIAKTLSKGLLMGARGNSGVILSQIFRGVAKSLKGKETANVAELSDAFSSGAKVAYKAVMRPVEGTILTVIRESADAAAKYVQPDMEIEDWFSYFVKSAEKSLDNTPELLPVLKEVGVVDSGGAGLLLVLTGFMAALAGEVIEKVDNVGAASDVEIVQEEEKPYGYRVQFTLKIDDRKMNAFNLDGFINELKNLPGKNVDVAQKDNKVIGNVDTLKPGNALNTGLRFGEFTKVTVVNTEVSEEEKEEEEKKIRHQIEMVDWYKDYFTYMERNEDAPCVMHLKERYYLQVPCYKRDLLADMEIRLAKEKSEQGIDNAMYLRQYGYKISYDAFCKQKFRPDYYFIYLNEKVKDAPNILKLPEGDYLCFRERILEEAWNPQRIISYFQGKAKPELMLAMEYEDNLDNYAHANYEIQILLEKN